MKNSPVCIHCPGDEKGLQQYIWTCGILEPLRHQPVADFQSRLPVSRRVGSIVDPGIYIDPSRSLDEKERMSRLRVKEVVEEERQIKTNNRSFNK